ncbi:P2Y purinoceptor 14 [Fundulus heteroclitus]|uniref:P2Y purinoceptor 14 n=1 Tax=Fundulus heteroclitus TaxID=8078 RepID=UPI00165A7A5C|nr:P2Y purinoceptor 14 [Fundulus heteroclitus]
MTSNGSTNQTLCDPISRSSLPGFIFIYSLVFLAGMILNSFTLWFHFCRAEINNSKSWMIYLKNLTIADFLLCLGLPLRIADYAGSHDTVHQFYCTFGAAIFYLNMYTSILLMGYIAASRYMRIFQPSRASFLMTVPAARLISAITWGFFLLPIIVYIILTLDTSKPPPASTTCDVLLSGPAKLFYTVIHASAFVIFLLVLGSLVFFYYSTSRRVQQVQQRRLGSSNSNKLLKSRRNMLVLGGVFCVCFVPYHLVRLPYIVLRGQCSVVLYYLKEATVLISVFNICLDPLIYVFLCKDFRAQLNLLQMFSTPKDSSSISSEVM